VWRCAGVEDPANEFLHLHEIRDALKTEFGGEQAARTTLGIERTAWSEFRRLANAEPVKQGRHRGKRAGEPLRDATALELSHARSFASNLIEEYMRYLERAARARHEPSATSHK
jgi:hypothetical protein